MLGSVRAMSQGGANLNRSVYCGSANGNIYVWYYSSDELGRTTIPGYHLEVFVGHKAPITAIECIWLDIFQNESVVSTDEDGTLIIWDLDGNIAHQCHDVRGASSLSVDRIRMADCTDVNPNSVTIMVGCQEGIRAWKICRGLEWEEKNGAGKFVNQRSATEVFDTRDETTVQKPFISRQGGAKAIHIENFKDSKRDLWTVIENQVLCLRRNSNWTTGIVLRHDQIIKHLVISEAWDMVITSSADKKLRIWDAKSGDMLHQFLVEGGVPGIVVVDLDKWKGVVACGDDGKILRWSCIRQDSR